MEGFLSIVCRAGVWRNYFVWNKLFEHMRYVDKQVDLDMIWKASLKLNSDHIFLFFAQ